MKQERFSEERIVGMLREAEKSEKPIADLCREHGIAEQTFYRWRRRYGGLETSDVQRLKERQVKTQYIEPGSPWQNAYGESFNGRFRDECLNMEVFYSLAEAATIVEMWRRSYNHERPHSSLAYQTPAEFASAWQLEPTPAAECELHARTS